MWYEKRPLSLDQQISLMSSRGLDCSDKARAEKWLRHAGYYRLSAYFIPFRIDRATTEAFVPGTTFNQILDLYKFDCGLRLLVLQALDRIEVSVRARLTYHFALDLGPFGYIDQTNFSPWFDHPELLSTIAREERRSSEVFIKHYRKKYTEPHLPIWMVTEILSFGAISRMYEAAKPATRKQIARDFNQPHAVFASWLHCLAAVRNICAHHNRLWNRELAIRPKLPELWKSAPIDNGRFYVVALILQSLLSIVAPQSRWSVRLKNLIDQHSAVNLHAMRFPADWQEVEPWASAHSENRKALTIPRPNPGEQKAETETVPPPIESRSRTKRTQPGVSAWRP
jgi:abortive infection bacteriophage resistance protein